MDDVVEDIVVGPDGPSTSQGDTRRGLQMMQSAWCQHDACRVTLKIDPIDRIRVLSRARLLTCPNCARCVQVKAGEVNAWHFAHWDERDTECYDDFGEPDGPEHQAMKLAVVDFLKRVTPAGSVIEIEVPIVETHQRSDVLALLPDGRRIAVEVQVTPISGSQWAERHTLYTSVGIEDIWLLGQTLFQGFEMDSTLPAPALLDGAVGCAVTRSRRLSSLMEAIGQATKRIFFLDALTVSDGPRLGMLCRIDQQPRVFRAVHYTFSLSDSGISVGRHRLVTPYDRWAAEQEKRGRAAAADQHVRDLADIAERQAQATDKKRRETVRLHACEVEYQRLRQRRENMVRKWRRDSVSTRQWQDLGTLEPDARVLAICDTRVPGWHLLQCDPRLWITYLYYGTVWRPWQGGERVWPYHAASQCLAEEFAEFHHPSTHGDPEDRVYKSLDGFSTYFSTLGVLQHPSVSGEWRILQPISREFPDMAHVVSIQETMRCDDLAGLREWVFRTSPGSTRLPCRS
jgi:hypothetical protein